MGITFNITLANSKESQGRLRWSEKGLDSPAISGPHGNGSLPDGLYLAKHTGFMDRSGEEPYCDKSKNCWFQFLEPQFSTPRTDLGIHPDGNVRGTAGCIGLLDENCSAWRQAFESLSADIPLEVRIVPSIQPISSVLSVTELLEFASPWPNDNQSDLEIFFGKHSLGTTGKPTVKWEVEHITTITLPYRMALSWDLSKIITRIRCNKKVAGSLERIFERILAHYGSEKEVQKNRMHLFGGSYEYRRVAGSGRLSTHAWGAAIDLDPERNLLGKPWNGSEGMMPSKVIAIFEAEGWKWGGRFQNRKDCMHFQATS